MNAGVAGVDDRGPHWVNRVLITGASGSGTTTLGAALAKKFDAVFIDADDFLWLPTRPPYTEKRPAAERLALILGELQRHERAVVAGSVMGWGTELETAFDLVVFLFVETSIRLQRLAHRDLERHGTVNPEFIAWAAQYDQGPSAGRSLARHTAWLESLNCQVVRLDGDLAVAERLDRLAPHLRGPSRRSA